MADPVSAVVDVKSSWASKINWTAGLGLLATVLALFGINLDPETQKAAIAAIAGVTTLVIWVQRTFFTTSITPSSAAKLP